MEYFGVTTLNFAAVAVTLAMAVLTSMMLILGKTRLHFVWGLFCLIVTLWIGGFYGALLSSNPIDAEFWWKISYIGVILIPFTFFHFILEFTNILDRHKKPLLLISYVAALCFVYIDLNTNLIVDGVKFSFNELFYGRPGLLHPYFFVLYLILVVYCFYLVYKQSKIGHTDPHFHEQSFYFFVSNLIAFVGGSLNFLPIYGINVPPITNASVAFGAGLLTYAMLKHHLFNARVVTAQLLTFILGSFALAKLILSQSTSEFIVNAFFAAVTLIVGVYLIISVRKEVEQRDQLELANQGQANLIHIINHQIKGYLAKSRNIFAELLSDDSYGPVSGEMKPMLEEGMKSLSEGVDFVQQVLNSSSAEKGTLSYVMEPIDFKEVVNEMFEHEKPQAAEKHLALELKVEEGDYKTKGDFVQLKEAVRNLIGNSVIYTESGSVKINLNKKGDKILMTVTDTGVGLTDEDKQRLFTKGGRGKDSLKVNINSTGYGLSFVKAVVDAHKGRVWATSEGRGKGSTFSLELPVS
jgi:signal transduction histidine kinase